MKTLSNIEARHEALRGSSKLCELLLEGFRFNSADARGKALMRQQHQVEMEELRRSLNETHEAALEAARRSR